MHLGIVPFDKLTGVHEHQMEDMLVLSNIPYEPVCVKLEQIA